MPMTCVLHFERQADISGHLDLVSQQGQSNSVPLSSAAIPILAQSMAAPPSLSTLSALVAGVAAHADVTGARLSDSAIKIARMARRRCRVRCSFEILKYNEPTYRTVKTHLREAASDGIDSHIGVKLIRKDASIVASAEEHVFDECRNHEGDDDHTDEVHPTHAPYPIVVHHWLITPFAPEVQF